MKIAFGQKIDVNYRYVSVAGSGLSNGRNWYRITQLRKDILEPFADKIWGPGNYTMDTYERRDTETREFYDHSSPAKPVVTTVQILTGKDMEARKLEEEAGLRKTVNTGGYDWYPESSKKPDYVFEYRV